MMKKVAIAMVALILLLTLVAVFALTNRVNLLLSLVQTKPTTAITATSTPSTVLSLGGCEGTGSFCLKFKHESELSLPPLSNSGCPPYKLPELSKLPTVKELDIAKDTTSEQVNDILLKYVEKVLDADNASKALLLKDYQDYLAGCTKTQDATAPSTPTQ